MSHLEKMKNGLDIFLICDTLYPVDNYDWTAGACSRFFFFLAVFPVVTRFAQPKLSPSESRIYEMQIP